MKGSVQKWFIDKGYGFLQIKGHSVFCHADRVMKQDWLRVGGIVWAKVVEDKARGGGSWKATDAWDPVRWDEERANQKAMEAVRMATKASRIACQSVEKGQRMLEAAEDARMRLSPPPQIGINRDIGLPPGLARDQG